MGRLPGVLVAGHICLDIIPDMQGLAPGAFDETFQPGRLVEVGAATLCTGGPVSNTGLALHKLGIPTRLVCKVGQDAFGQAVRSIVATIDPRLVEGMVTDPHVSTSYSLIISPPGVDRLFLHSPGANHTFSAQDIDLALVQQADLFHFGYPPVMRRMYLQEGQGLVEVFRLVKAGGATTSLDMCYPDPTSEGGKVNWRKILQATLPYVDIFLPSIEELLVILHRPLFERLEQNGSLLDQITPALLYELSNELLDMGVRLAVIKLGERGLYLRTASEDKLAGMGRARSPDLAAWANQELWAPCFRVKVVGTTGSGDATIAGFLSALLRKYSPQEAVTLAVAVGACNVEAADALSGLRSWEDTLERVRSGWERLPLSLDAPNWEWDEDRQVWYHI